MPAHRLLVGLGKAALASMVVAAVFVGYVYYAEISAAGKAKAFCEATDIGASVEGLQVRAIAANPEERETRWIAHGDGTDILPVTFVGFSPLSRHFCSVTVRGGVVSSKEVGFLD